MSDTTFSPAFASAAGAPSASRLRAGVRRFRQVAAGTAEFVNTYSVIEGACLLGAMVFGGMVIAASFGLSV